MSSVTNEILENALVVPDGFTLTQEDVTTIIQELLSLRKSDMVSVYRNMNIELRKENADLRSALDLAIGVGSPCGKLVRCSSLDACCVPGIREILEDGFPVKSST